LSDTPLEASLPLATTATPPVEFSSSLGEQPLSPLDGRYRSSTAPLTEHLSEAALNRARTHVEIEWLLFLADKQLFGVTRVSADEAARLRAFASGFGPAQLAELAQLEATTRHDVKAVEYLVRAELARTGLSRIVELTHFACTSEDINNIAYALNIRAALELVWLPGFTELIEQLKTMAVGYRDDAMLALTHGQPATPTTLGKELAVFAHRLERIATRVGDQAYSAKFNGATGTFSAHLIADENADWQALSREFVSSFGLVWSPLTTQIESHDWQVELYQAVAHGGRILHNLCTDVWSYISAGYLRQVAIPGATGSSTMPHKVNPIRFENAEANLEIAGALLEVLSNTLPTSRLQRDLTDSTTQRNIGVALGHSLVAIDNIRRGLHEVSIDRDRMNADLDANWEVLAEAVQTVIRAETLAGRSAIKDPYLLLKDFTRGKRVEAQDYRRFVESLEIGEAARSRLLHLTPERYTGLASALVDQLIPAPGPAPAP